MGRVHYGKQEIRNVRHEGVAGEPMTKAEIVKDADAP